MKKTDALKKTAALKAKGKARPAKRGPVPGAGRRGNPAALKVMVLQVTKKKPLTRQEILVAVQKAGYKFVAKDPLNSLSTLLYTAKEIKNFGAKFGPK
jgi:hypothetical protein